jgi:hypothetical protein
MMMNDLSRLPEQVDSSTLAVLPLDRCEARPGGAMAEVVAAIERLESEDQEHHALRRARWVRMASLLELPPLAPQGVLHHPQRRRHQVLSRAKRSATREELPHLEGSSDRGEAGDSQAPHHLSGHAAFSGNPSIRSQHAQGHAGRPTPCQHHDNRQRVRAGRRRERDARR